MKDDEEMAESEEDQRDIDEMEFDGMDEEMGEEEMEEEIKDDGDRGEANDDADSCNIDTNIESKRDKAISDLLKKEDLGLI